MGAPRLPLSAAQESVGKERFSHFVECQAKVDAEQMFLTLSVANCGMAGYSDEALEAMRTDAKDLVDAARSLEDYINALATTWTVQKRADDANGDEDDPAGEA